MLRTWLIKNRPYASRKHVLCFPNPSHDENCDSFTGLRALAAKRLAYVAAARVATAAAEEDHTRLSFQRRGAKWCGTQWRCIGHRLERSLHLHTTYTEGGGG